MLPTTSDRSRSRVVDPQAASADPECCAWDPRAPSRHDLTQQMEAVANIHASQTFTHSKDEYTAPLDFGGLSQSVTTPRTC